MLTIIAAVAKNKALGKNNDLIWRLPADLKRFKKTIKESDLEFDKVKKEKLKSKAAFEANKLINK